MNFTNVKLIFGREMRDQLRDRRTLFMVAVLPLLFYPLLGFSFFQIAQFLQEEPSKVLVVGHIEMKGLPALFEMYDGQRRFDDKLFSDPKKAVLLQPEFRALPPALPGEPRARVSKADLLREVEDGRYQTVIYFPPDFSRRLDEYRAKLKDIAAGRVPSTTTLPKIPEPEIIGDNRQEKSAVAVARVTTAMQTWTENVGKKTLADSNVPENAANPIKLRHQYVGAPEIRIDTSLWSKILPFVLMIWAVTGAFYPAIDLCAGEKERGTLETLLSSPAQRSEIVMGKLLTVMVFSVVTAVLNLLSMGITGGVVMSHLGPLPTMANVGPPPMASLGWLIVVLLPVSALFSAVCLALAAFARSTKEGQYYLMPVILITMPLILVPMAPSAELNLGTSLVPISGIVLLMRAMMEGQIARLWPYAIPVMAVTFVSCWLAIRWAIEQFSSESVLFREGERWDLSSWVAHLLRDRQATPSVAMAVMCGVLILVIRFFVNLAMPPAGTFWDLFQQTFVNQVVVIATPALLMTIILTRSPVRTLLLRLPLSPRSVLAVPAAALLALLLHPFAHSLQAGIQWLYPVSSGVQEFGSNFLRLLQRAPNIWVALLTLAVLPAVCEELAFRGFILSGFRHLGHKFRAIVFSAVIFGFAHWILQQSILATILGCVLGYIAVQTGSIWPAITYHVVHNSIFYVVGVHYGGSLAGTQLDWLQTKLANGPYLYQPWLVGMGVLGGVLILFWLSRFTVRRTREEAIQEAVEHEAVHSLAG